MVDAGTVSRRSQASCRSAAHWSHVAAARPGSLMPFDRTCECRRRGPGAGNGSLAPNARPRRGLLVGCGGGSFEPGEGRDREGCARRRRRSRCPDRPGWSVVAASSARSGRDIDRGTAPGRGPAGIRRSATRPERYRAVRRGRCEADAGIRVVGPLGGQYHRGHARPVGTGTTAVMSPVVV